MSDVKWLAKKNGKYLSSSYRIENDDLASYSFCDVHDENGHTVCVVTDDNEFPLDTDGLGRRAHLIAAAPELYEALADAIDDLEQVFKICHGYVDTSDLARYRNALAKAKGQ